MQFRRFGLRFRRKLRQTERQVEGLGGQAERDLERYFFKRFARLRPVRRFVLSWMLLLLVLIIGVIGQNFNLSNYYQTLRPVPGGIYNEGILGTFTTANPLYATSDVDQSVSKLLFAGLFTYNQQNQLVGDLASGYSVDSKGTTYTVQLKPRLTWQDGQPLTSADVVYTYQAIQNPDAQSPLQANWQGISVKATSPTTVTFTLPNTLASFPYTLTNGIVPQHILGNVPPADLRTADFSNVHPVGAGPFAWSGVQVSGTDPENAEEQVALKPFSGYQGSAPKLEEYVVHAYGDQTQLAQAFKQGGLNAASGFSEEPSSLKTMSSLQQHSFLLTAGTYTFFKTTNGVLSDAKVRQALVQGANEPQIIGQLGFSTLPVTEPLLKDQLAYNATDQQATYNFTAAAAALTADGWMPGSNGIRTKAGQSLSFTLSAEDTPEYRTVTKLLQQQWRRLGVNMQVQLQDSEDFQTTLSYHDYDAVLYGISIGVDPDVFVYWDSSQADIRSTNRLNLSEWKNPTADTALESGRTRLDPALRTIKYQPFLQAWQQDAPALGLYQPRYLYVTNGSVYGLNDMTLNAATDRYANVQNWEVHEAKVTNL
jgi:peptide/nickel transport system substrate-binding protein